MSYSYLACDLAAEYPPPPSPPLSDKDHDRGAEVCKPVDLPSVQDFVAEDACKFTYERNMGGSELSYYLPSRADGVNDMYLHLGFRASQRICDRSRICAVWAILRLRHPLLAAHVRMHNYEDVRFVYHAPADPNAALEDADSNLEYRTQSKHDLIDTYLNGPRTLSNERISYLIVSTSGQEHAPIPTPLNSPTADRILDATFEACQGEDEVLEYDILICAAHFLGDGMALHRFANDFFQLLGSGKSGRELEDCLFSEWESRWGREVDASTVLPVALEDSLAPIKGKFRQAASKVDFRNSQDKAIGGHAFPRSKNGARRTVVPTVPLNEQLTKLVLKKCKANGVSIANALFAICNIAWIRMSSSSPELPISMYSALNLRPYLDPSPKNESYWFLAIGYFNIILPNFLPCCADVSKIFWHRARDAKAQSTRVAKHPLLISRTHEMARERGQRARSWAKEDDDKELGVWTPPPPKSNPTPADPTKAPSLALVGLSLLGNLDGIYKHALFPSIELHTLTTGSRQRSGAMLLFGYTFASKLWLSLGYDENGLDKVVVEKFWSEVLNGVNEFLLD